MILPQWSMGLDAPIRKEGCLFLVYLWVGWLYRIWVRGGAAPQVVPEVVNDSYDVLERMGAIRDDCYVGDPERVIQFPWHYWHPPAPELDQHQVTVEKLPAIREHGSPLLSQASRRVPELRGSFVVDVTHWELDGRHHFTGLCLRPACYFDPWVVSEIARAGRARSVRRVTIRRP